jgi:disulfide bond formation protein DsbB
MHHPETAINVSKINRISTQTLFAAWLVALASTLGALFIGEIMGKMPCILCWYQRIGMFPLAVLLGIGLFREEAQVKYYALPFSLAGLGIAVFHNLLYFGILPESIRPCAQNGPSCTSMDMTILGGLPIPLLSAVAFTLITILLFITRRKHTP